MRTMHHMSNMLHTCNIRTYAAPAHRSLWSKPMCDSVFGDVVSCVLRQLVQHGQDIADTKKRQAHKVFILLDMNRHLQVMQ